MIVAGDVGCRLGSCIGWRFKGLQKGAEFGFGELIAAEGFSGGLRRRLRKWFL